MKEIQARDRYRRIGGLPIFLSIINMTTERLRDIDLDWK